MNKDISKQLRSKIFFSLLGIIFLFILYVGISNEPEIVFFIIVIIFLLTFMFFAVKILIDRVNFLKSSDAFAAKILNTKLYEIEVPNQHFYTNPMYFHVFLIVLIVVNLLLAYFNIGVYDNSYYERFYADLAFQFNAAIFFTIVGFLNPFLEIPEAFKNNIKDSNAKLFLFISNEKKLFYTRMLCCVLVFLLFIYNKWLVFPNFLNDNLVLRGIDIALMLFVIMNTFRMIKYAKSFLVENIFRVVKSFSIFTSALFVLVPLVPITMLLLYAFDIDESSFNFLPIPFIGFNLIMVFVEYSLNSKNQPQNLKT